MPHAIVLHNKEAAPGYFKMGLKWGVRPAVAPGQFIMLRVEDSFDPFLRRPFSIYDEIKGGIEIFYKVVGKGSTIMSSLKPGSELDITGPLGNGFPPPRDGDHPPASGRVLMAAGGIGIAPLYLFAKKFSKRKGVELTLLYGAKTKTEALFAADFKNLGVSVKVSTDDGSAGVKGLVTDILKKELDKGEVSSVYSCGPAAMLKQAARISEAVKTPCFVSLERGMACGIGVCLGCAVKIKKEPCYKMVCSDGPVFKSEDIDWERF